MRIEEREAAGDVTGPALGRGRLADRLGPVGRWLRGRRAAPWRVAALASATALAAASTVLRAPDPPRVEWLGSFAPDEAEAIRRALSIKGIDAETDPGGRVGVSPAKASEAWKVLDQQGLNRRPLIQEVDDPARASIIADPQERADVFLRGEARKIERAIEEVPGILSAVVFLQPSPNRRHFANPELARAGIQLWADRGRPISPTTVDRVLNKVIIVTGLKAEDVTVIDSHGDALLKAGDPSFARGIRAEARAREWEASIAERLAAAVDGARVEVRLERPIVAEESPASRDESAAGDAPGPVVVANGPMSLDPPASPKADEAEPPVGRANVLVEVPASYYLNRHRDSYGNREAGAEDLQRLVDFTERYIREIVAHVVPEEALGRLQILMLPLPADPAEPASASGEPLGWAGYWWAPAVALGLGACLALLAAAGGLMPGRRPAGRSVSETTAGAPHRRPPLLDDDEPGPGDRVRELVRRDPVASAAVLRRWVGQGADT